MSQIRLEANGYRLSISPAFGASWTEVVWIRPDGQAQPLMLELPAPSEGLHGGNFIMAPFTNRIADGRFSFEGQEYQTVVNNVAEGMAIHGSARKSAWQVQSQSEDAVTLQLEYQGEGPWHYRLVQEVALRADGIHATLSITNLGEAAVPFGFGYHPWFPRTPQTSVTFHSNGAHRQDGRALPLIQTDTIAALDPMAPQPISDASPLDHCFSDWEPHEAQITWPEARTRLTLRGSEAFRHIQVYAPSGKEFFCVEPVTHLPDAINRPELGARAAMHRLAPGETLTATMILTASEV